MSHLATSYRTDRRGRKTRLCWCERNLMAAIGFDQWVCHILGHLRLGPKKGKYYKECFEVAPSHYADSLMGATNGKN